MFSIVFPGQGSQKIGMVKEFYNKYDLAKKLFKDADAILNVPITKIIFEGPEDKCAGNFGELSKCAKLLHKREIEGG